MQAHQHAEVVGVDATCCVQGERGSMQGHKG